MRILSAAVKNFGSYKSLDFSFTDQGLTLISGATGSGKSTLCDIIPWVLFGRTAKNGTADEIRSWDAEGPTYGHIILDMGEYSLWIARTRGPNDLYYVIDGVWENPKRGKDLGDTQKLINELLGINAETFLAGAYFHEFSQTAQFFTTTAKIRRSITEQLADLTLAKNLTENLSEYNKELKKDMQIVAVSISTAKSLLDQTTRMLSSEVSRADMWQMKHDKQLTTAEDKALNFETLQKNNIILLGRNRDEFNLEIQTKVSMLESEIKNEKSKHKDPSYFEEKEFVLSTKRLQLGTDVCELCGGPKNADKHLILDKEAYALKVEKLENSRHETNIVGLLNQIDSLKRRNNPYIQQIEQEKQRVNTYIDQLQSLRDEVNPHIESVDQLKTHVHYHKEDLKDAELDMDCLKYEQADVELLIDTVSELRGVIISRTASFLEESTNKFLSDHFDAELRVTFDIETADKLDVTISKDGNECSYTQLSKGQRQLLKLCFGLSVMKAVSNHSGASFNCLFLDECTDGLDEAMKAKAFDLLSALQTSYESIFLVEHSESLKTLFTNRIDVILENGNSIIKEQA